MRYLISSLLILFLFPGCEVLRELGSTKVDNPVMGPPPPRKILANNDTKSSELQTAELPSTTTGPKLKANEILRVSAATSQNGLEQIPDNHVVATVNGSPIFAGEVLERYGPQLRAARKQLTDAEYEKLRLKLIDKNLESHIERKMLVLSLMEMLKPEQREMFQEQLTSAFDEQLNKFKKQFKVETRLEVDRALQKQGTSLNAVKDAFDLQQMAQQYLALKAKRPHIGRPEIYAYYQEHLDDYAIPEKVKWQHLQIKFALHGGKSGALKVLNQAILDLKQGLEFPVVVQKYSDGATASDGGLWDWMERGSLANEEIEKTLFELPVGQISPPFKTDDDFQMVRVLDRAPAHHTPFEEVQEAIRDQLTTELRKASLRSVLDELKASTQVETIIIELPKF